MSDRPVYTLLTIDGADEDGCTLYVLRDERGEVLHSCSWPQPLEHIASAHGARLVMAPTLGLHELEIEPPTPNGKGRDTDDHDVL